MTPAAILLVVLLAARGQAPSQEVRPGVAENATGPAPIRVQTALSQTALWAGQVVTYTVTVTCRRGVDILQGDLDADKLVLQGLQVVGQSLDRRVIDDAGTQYVASYRLTTFEPGVEQAGIGDWVVRYASGATTGASVAAQELHIPGAPIAWRSALPDEPRTLDLRGDRGVESIPDWWRFTRSVALGLIALSVVSGGALVATRVASRQPKEKRRRARREAARDLRTTLSELEAADMSTPAARVSAYERLEAAVRRHVGETTGLPAASLTAAELARRANGTPLPLDEVSRVLESCQRARFAPVDRVPDAEEFRGTLAGAQRIAGS